MASISKEEYEKMTKEERLLYCAKHVNRTEQDITPAAEALSKAFQDKEFVEKTSSLIKDLFNVGKKAEKSVKESYKETLIRKIEQFLPMSYEEFKKLDLDEQQRIIDSVKEQQGNIQKDLFQQRFDSYISDLEEDSDLHLGLIEEDEEDMKDYNKPKVLKRRNIKKILDDDIED